MKKTSKLLVLFVVLSLLISMVSVSAFAETAPAAEAIIVGSYDEFVKKGEKNQVKRQDAVLLSLKRRKRRTFLFGFMILSR